MKIIKKASGRERWSGTALSDGYRIDKASRLKTHERVFFFNGFSIRLVLQNVNFNLFCLICNYYYYYYLAVFLIKIFCPISMFPFYIGHNLM